MNAGLLLERTGRVEEACTAFEQAIDPSSSAAFSRAVAHLARLLLRTKDKDTAKTLLGQWRNAENSHLAEVVTDAFEELRSRPARTLELLTEPW